MFALYNHLSYKIPGKSVHMYVCAYLCEFACACHLWVLYLYMFMDVYLCVHVYMLECMHLRVWGCLYVSMCLCICICVCIYIFMCVHAHMYELRVGMEVCVKFFIC